MTTLAYPTLSQPPTRMPWYLIGNTQAQESPANQAIQTQELPGALWGCTIVYEALDELDARRLRAFLATMRGRAGRVTLPHLAQAAPLGVGGGTPLVKGAGQTGTALVVDGCGVSVTNWLRIGDFVGVDGLLFMQTADVSSNGAGEVTLTLAPPVLVAPPDNAVVTLASPTVVMRLTDDRQGWEYTGVPLHDITIDLIEVPT